MSFYPFTIILEHSNGSCNNVNDLSAKVYVSSKTKDLNVKVYNNGILLQILLYIWHNYMPQSVDFNFDNIWIDEISHENILIYKISYKFLICGKPLSIRFNKVNRFIRDYDQAKYLELFGDDKYDAT